MAPSHCTRVRTFCELNRHTCCPATFMVAGMRANKVWDKRPEANNDPQQRRHTPSNKKNQNGVVL